MSETERLAAIEDIRQLKARYFRLMDTKRWDEWEQLFVADAVMDMRTVGGPPIGKPLGPARPGEEGVYVGPAAMRQYISAALDPGTPVHHGYTPEIQITSATSATGIWAMDYYTRWPEGSPIRAVHGYGHYHDEYVKIAGEWRIKSTRAETLAVDITR